uniref:Uncharacterized protein n=1 Tax=Arundo donax TaxID=35708 RepID=A0A0A9DZM9_ARUDO
MSGAPPPVSAAAQALSSALPLTLQSFAFCKFSVDESNDGGTVPRPAAASEG